MQAQHGLKNVSCGPTGLVNPKEKQAPPWIAGDAYSEHAEYCPAPLLIAVSQARLQIHLQLVHRVSVSSGGVPS